MSCIHLVLIIHEHWGNSKCGQLALRQQGDVTLLVVNKLFHITLLVGEKLCSVITLLVWEKLCRVM